MAQHHPTVAVAMEAATEVVAMAIRPEVEANPPGGNLLSLDLR